MPRRPIDRTQLSAVLLSTLLAVSIVGAVALAPVVAEHPDDAPDYTGQAYFEVSEVSQSDHQPGDQQGSMQYFAGGSEAFNDQNAEEGVFIDYIIIDSFYDGSQWIDYSNCNTENTAAFGIDRGSNNSGTNYDEDLVQKQKQVDFRQDGITIEFYNHEDLGGDPPYMAPEDAIVAQQGEGSAAGPCLQYTDEPGWYRMQGFLNGTVADNGRNNAPSENAEQVSVAVQSTWFYICDCESREEAEEKLGPPGEGGDGGGGGESTATPGGDEGGDGDGESTATPGGDGAGGGEGTGNDSDAGTGNGSGAGTGNDSDAGTGNGSGAGTGNGSGAGTGNGSGAGNDTNQSEGDTFEGDDGEGTPTADDGPGFGALAALFALLGSALLLNRRR